MEGRGMDTGDIETLRQRLQTLVLEHWQSQDPDITASSTLRQDGKIDMQVVSRLFEGKDGLEREAFFYPVFDPVPKTDMMRMTYCLLLTPAEAARNFAQPGKRAGADNRDDWT